MTRKEETDIAIGITMFFHSKMNQGEMEMASADFVRSFLKKYPRIVAAVLDWSPEMRGWLENMGIIDENQ